SRAPGSERNVVVAEFGIRLRERGPRLFGAGARPAAAPFARSEHLDALCLDLGRRPLVAVLVVPFARRQRALDVHLAALLEVLTADLGLVAPADDPVPFGPLLLRAGLVRPLLVGREREVADRVLP